VVDFFELNVIDTEYFDELPVGTDGLVDLVEKEGVGRVLVFEVEVEEFIVGVVELELRLQGVIFVAHRQVDVVKHVFYHYPLFRLDHVVLDILRLDLPH
jgi:hypothetical protein